MEKSTILKVDLIDPPKQFCAFVHYVNNHGQESDRPWNQ